jgi:hypothetical protein
MRLRSMNEPIRQGEYFCSARELYHVEHVADGHVLLEDCRSGELVDVPVAHLRGLTRLPDPADEAAGVAESLVPGREAL